MRCARVYIFRKYTGSLANLLELRRSFVDSCTNQEMYMSELQTQMEKCIVSVVVDSCTNQEVYI